MVGSIAAGATLIAWSLSLIDETTAKMLLGVVATWTGVALRLAIRKGQ